MAIPRDRVLQVLAALARTDAAVGDAHLVGGCVRDMLLGLAVRDVDMAAASALEVAGAAARAAGSRVVTLGDAAHPLYRVPLQGGQLDVTPRRGTIEEDLAQRDFTVNAMALPLRRLGSGRVAPRAVIDPFGGRRDLQARRIRAVRPSVFTDDPVRGLRAARLAAVLDFEVEESTASALPSALPGLASVAPERVGAELLRLFEAERTTRGVRVLDAAGLLDFCFPELAEGHGVEQRPVHTYTVHRHQLVAFGRVDELLAPERPPEAEAGRRWDVLWRGRDWSRTPWGTLREVLDRHRAAVRIATLLHDVGKPRTRTVEADGRTRFFGHAEVGATLAADRLRAWRFSSETVERVALLIGQHLRPGQVAAPGDPPTARALHRFHRALGDATPDVCMLFLADSLATSPEAVAARWPAYVAHVHRIVTWAPPVTEAGPQRLIDGREVMAATGLPPGPAVGRILEAVEEAAAAGELRTPEEARELARQLCALDGGGSVSGGGR